MAKTIRRDRSLPDYTRNEERFHSISHIVGCVFGIFVLVICAYKSLTHDNHVGVVTSIIYGICMISLYAVSGIYHGLHSTRSIKKLFRTLDHCSIFLLIAGTYTPIALCAMRIQNAALGWGILAVIWIVAILGISLNAIDIKKFQIFSLLCYLIMGWGILIFAKPLYSAVGGVGVALLVAGGISYSIGAVIYAALKRVRYSHSIFHILCLAGSVLHFLCIYCYVL
jgi:channel protein, hemolysin III family